jgi:hypothetical protein
MAEIIEARQAGRTHVHVRFGRYGDRHSPWRAARPDTGDANARGL